MTVACNLTFPKNTVDQSVKNECSNQPKYLGFKNTNDWGREGRNQIASLYQSVPFPPAWYLIVSFMLCYIFPLHTTSACSITKLYNFQLGDKFLPSSWKLSGFFLFFPVVLWFALRLKKGKECGYLQSIPSLLNPFITHLFVCSCWGSVTSASQPVVQNVISSCNSCSSSAKDSSRGRFMPNVLLLEATLNFGDEDK